MKSNNGCQKSVISRLISGILVLFYKNFILFILDTLEVEAQKSIMK